PIIWILLLPFKELILEFSAGFCFSSQGRFYIRRLKPLEYKFGPVAGKDNPQLTALTISCVTLQYRRLLVTIELFSKLPSVLLCLKEHRSMSLKIYIHINLLNNLNLFTRLRSCFRRVCIRLCITYFCAGYWSYMVFNTY
ncbi:hypothetical protein L9F63_011142, partial [Diploptera punctata]